MYPLISRTRFILKIAQELTCLIVCILELLLNEGLKVVIAGIGIWPEHIRFCTVTHTKSKKKCPCFSFWTWGFPTCDDSGDNFLQHLDLLPPRQKWVHSTNWCGICSSGHACTDTQENINMQFMIFQVSCWKQLGMQASSHGRTTNERQLQ